MPTPYLNRDQFMARYTEVDRSDSVMALQSVLATCDASSTVGVGPLSNIALLVKDNIEAIGLPGCAGSLALMPTPATRDAELVTRLRAAGADIVGSANLSEWANLRSSHGTSGWSAVGGLTGNPWHLDRSAGGSSSGSGAAIAAGLVSVAIGSETDGSIVCPASLNGVVGLKPTVGSVSVQGVVPISASQDVPGPLAIDVELAALTYEVISGRQGMVEAVKDSSAISATLRVGVASNFMTEHQGTDEVFEEAVAAVTKLVASVGTSNAPAADDNVHGDEYTVLASEIFDDMASYLADRFGGSNPTGINTLADIVQFNIDNASHEMQHFDQDIFEFAVSTGGRANPDYAAARRRNLKWAEKTCLGPALEKFDVLIAPTYGPAWKSDLILGDRLAGGKISTPSALLGWPLLCVPMGLVDGMPVGLTIVGKALDEARMLALGAEIVKALGTRAEDGFRPGFKPASRG
jgi:amidase